MPDGEHNGEVDLEALRASERQYRRLFEAAQDGILILNSITGEIEDVNPFLVELLGFSREELMGRKLWEVGPFRDVAASKMAFEELQEKTYIRYEDLPLQTRGGRLVSVEFVSNVYSVNDAKVIQCNIRDITNRRHQDDLREAREEAAQARRVANKLQSAHEEAEAARRTAEILFRAKEEAEQANETKSRFITMLSHELRTPMNPLMMVLHAWKSEKRLPSEFLPDLEVMRRSVEIQTHLIDDLLDVTAISQGKIRLEFRPQDVHELLRYAIEVVQPQIDEHQLRVVMSLQATQFVVSTDFTRLAQVLWNLTKNAVKFTPAGGTITISTANEGGDLRIEIEDTGIGISEAALEGIFDPFEQGTQGRPHDLGGLGLGLTIAKRLIELLGGTISVKSDGAGTGTRFTLRLKTASLP